MKLSKFVALSLAFVVVFGLSVWYGMTAILDAGLWALIAVIIAPAVVLSALALCVED